MARLGVRPVDATTTLDLHRADFDVDERAIGIGTRVHVATALTAIVHAESATG
jgi:amidohydrolase